MYSKSETLRGKARMDIIQIETLMAHVLRIPSLLTQAVDDLKPEYFSGAGEAHLRLLWETAIMLYGRHDGRVTYTSLKGYLEQLEIDDSELLTDGQWDTLLNDKPPVGFLWWAYKVYPEADLDDDYGSDLIKRFLAQIVWERAQAAVGDTYDSIPDNFQPAIIEASRQLELIENMGNDVDYAPYPDSFERSPIVVTPLGFQPLDRLIGGLSPGERMGIMGPLESGKTALGVQLTVEGARLAQAAADDRGEALKHWYFVEYEQPVDPQIRSRLWSYAARIPRNRIDKLHVPYELGTVENRPDYELKKFAREIREDPNFPSERERFELEVRKLNRNLHMRDFSGVGKNGNNGTGGVAEIAAVLERNYKKHGWLPGGVVIDYALIMVKRYLLARDKDMSELRHHLSAVPDQLRRLICDRYGIPVIIFHQVSGAANDKKPGQPMKLTDSGESKTFAENLDICVCIGVKEPVSRVCMLHVAKARRERASGKTVLVRVDGKYSRMVGVDKQFMVTKHREIRSREEMEQMQGAEAVQFGASRRINTQSGSSIDRME